ncbi:hypothetical protein FA95DRAFT_1553189 [Auriscalpium vulgare]|uniref:Uncharacterized protein n=1 Tax=Auriscalpium vulgare TaxID=40419 RepID=A0ACB8SAG0_9AGAM|nr:hypothetical protein FA95DRAFT_1553189 [Auriscalpium vulgare]
MDWRKGERSVRKGLCKKKEEHAHHVCGRAPPDASRFRPWACVSPQKNVARGLRQHRGVPATHLSARRRADYLRELFGFSVAGWRTEQRGGLEKRQARTFAVMASRCCTVMTASRPACELLVSEMIYIQRTRFKIRPRPMFLRGGLPKRLIYIYAGDSDRR